MTKQDDDVDDVISIGNIQDNLQEPVLKNQNDEIKETLIKYITSPLAENDHRWCLILNDDYDNSFYIISIIFNNIDDLESSDVYQRINSIRVDKTRAEDIIRLFYCCGYDEVDVLSGLDIETVEKFMLVFEIAKEISKELLTTCTISTYKKCVSNVFREEYMSCVVDEFKKLYEGSKKMLTIEEVYNIVEEDPYPGMHVLRLRQEKSEN